MTGRFTLIAAALGLALVTGAASAAPGDATLAPRHGAVTKTVVTKTAVVKPVGARHVVGKTVVGKTVVTKTVVVKRLIVARPGHHRLFASPRHERLFRLARHHHRRPFLVETTGMKTVGPIAHLNHGSLAARIARHAERRAERRIERRLERHAMNHQGVATPVGVIG